MATEYHLGLQDQHKVGAEKTETVVVGDGVPAQ